MGSTKYITSMGELSRKDNSLCFRKNGKNIYIPIENTKEIYCLNEISLNSKLLDFLGRNNIIVHFFNYYGGYSGSFYPRNQYNSGKLLVKQVEKYKNNRIESTFLHTKLNRKISYRTAIKLDCYKLIKNILEDKEFIPFSLKNSY